MQGRHMEHILYIDFFSHLALMKRAGQPFSGANAGTNLLVLQIMASEYYKTRKIYLILPEGFKARDQYEEKIQNAEYFEKIYVKSLLDVHYEENSVLFVPLVCGKEFIEIAEIKAAYPNLIIYGRVHDKNHNFPLDLKDRYFYNGWKKTGLYSLIDFWGKKILFGIKYGKWVSNLDKIFTVSNYSMQALKHKNIQFINYYYQGILNIKDEILAQEVKDDYILFVNGGRPEKNLLRAIQGFELSNTVKNSDIKLHITSIKQDTKENVLRYLRKQSWFKENNIVFHDYLSQKDLAALYVNSKFLLFASKGEGFGLPVLESIMYGRPVLASSTTSIPEVAGASIRYFDPLNVNSISNGIDYMIQPDHLHYYEQTTQDRLKIIKQMIDQDAQLLIRELFED